MALDQSRVATDHRVERISARQLRRAKRAAVRGAGDRGECGELPRANAWYRSHRRTARMAPLRPRAPRATRRGHCSTTGTPAWAASTTASPNVSISEGKRKRRARRGNRRSGSAGSSPTRCSRSRTPRERAMSMSCSRCGALADQRQVPVAAGQQPYRRCEILGSGETAQRCPAARHRQEARSACVLVTAEPGRLALEAMVDPHRLACDIGADSRHIPFRSSWN